jgi:glycosyltransferase involved in cell wall biosynthesis
MKWLIVEDALRDRKGHWFEYVRAFRNGLLQLGDQVTVLADKNAEPFLQTELAAKPILPESIWHRMGDGAGVLTRYLRIPTHAFNTWRSVRTVLQTGADYDVIFVPTVSVHHLLGWVRLIKGVLQDRQVRVLLYFLSTPIRVCSDGSIEWVKSPTTRLLTALLRGLRTEIESGKLAIGVETKPLQKALSQLANVPVLYLPQPVEPLEQSPAITGKSLLFACYGAARHEKGSDVLQAAIERYLATHPQSRAKFAIQWIEDFADESGRVVAKSPKLMDDGRVEFISHYFRDGEYHQWMSRTSVMLLPYRLSSYQLRGSRVVIEAMVNGIPVVATRGTTLAQQAEEFGIVEICENEDVASLVAAIEAVERNYESLATSAREQQAKAREHFSVGRFRSLLCGTQAVSPAKSELSNAAKYL